MVLLVINDSGEVVLEAVNKVTQFDVSYHLSGYGPVKYFNNSERLSGVARYTDYYAFRYCGAYDTTNSFDKREGYSTVADKVITVNYSLLEVICHGVNFFHRFHNFNF